MEKNGKTLTLCCAMKGFFVFFTAAAAVLVRMF